MFGRVGTCLSSRNTWGVGALITGNFSSSVADAAPSPGASQPAAGPSPGQMGLYPTGSQSPVAGLGLGWDLKVGPLGAPVPSPGPLTQERLTQASLSWPSEHRGGRRAG